MRLVVHPPQPQRRVTVAFRLVLAIPVLLIAGVLSTAALAVIVVAWFAALFTARVPAGITDFLVQVLQYQARAYGYVGLLSGTYPPFDVDDGGDYAIELEVDRPGTFNRAAVFFRALLELPVLVVMQLATTGVFLLMLPLWLVTLLTGRLPATAHQAVAAVLRYQLRTYAYVGLVTTTYPRGLFGGGELVLTTAAKVMVVAFLVAGTAGNAVNASLNSSGFGLTSELADLDSEFDRSFSTWVDDVRSCTLRDDAGCERRVDARFLFDTDGYIADLRALDVPEEAHDERSTVIEELETISSHLGSLSETSGARDQQRLRFLIEDAKVRYEDAWIDLYDAVVFS